MTAQVSIVTQRRDNVLRLPSAALRFKPSEDVEAKAPPHRGSRVYKLSENGNLIAVEVRTGIADTRFTEVIGDNLKEGDALVVREISNDSGAPAAGGSNFRMRFF